MQLRPYQITATDFLCKNKHAILVVPTGGGKTVIAAAALAKLANKHSHPYKPKIVWLAPTNEILDQIRDTIERFPIISQKLDVHVKTVASQPMTADAHLLILDEAHHAPAATWEPLVSQTQGIRWAITATPYHPKDDERNKVFLRLFSHTMHSISHKELTDAGYILSANFIAFPFCDEEAKKIIHRERLAKIPEQLYRFKKIPLDFARDVLAGKKEDDGRVLQDTITQRITYQLCLKYAICESDKFNRFVAEKTLDALHAERNCLVLAHTIEQAEKLADYIPNAKVLTSKSGKRLRKEYIAFARSGALTCIIATSLADEGLDVPRFDTLVLAGSGRSPNKLTQRAGRILRTHREKKKPLIIDFYNSTNPMLQAQFYARRRVFRALGFTDITPR
jgi:superfamily II DNA or RNA helicase